MVFAVLIIANSVMQQIEENGDTMNRLVGLMLGLLVPACGYAGAKNANRSLLSCFWGCNAFSAVCNTMAVAMWILIILVYDEDITSAHQTCYVRRPRPAAAPAGCAPLTAPLRAGHAGLVRSDRGGRDRRGLRGPGVRRADRGKHDSRALRGDARDAPAV